MSDTRKLCRGPVWEALISIMQQVCTTSDPLDSRFLTREEAEKAAYRKVRLASKQLIGAEK